MKIITLLENTTLNGDLTAKHGLSLYIETTAHKLLFDLGPDDTFFHNARKLGVDLSQVDTVIISHGHYDHGGGLSKFLDINDKAQIYFQRRAFLPYYSKILLQEKYIGLKPDLSENKRNVFVDDSMRIDDELFLFSDTEGHFHSKSNRPLYRKAAGIYVNDDFTHEQSLILTQGNKALLFSGCSHRGITNILCSARKHCPDIQAVFGGFHLFNPITHASEPRHDIHFLAEELDSQNIVFYTCHCTGTKAFDIMQAVLGDKLKYISTGSVTEL